MVAAAMTEAVLLAQQAERKVPEPTRTIALMALLGIVLVGLLLIAFTMLGASWARKQGFRRRSIVPTDKFLPRDAESSPEPPAKHSSNKMRHSNMGDTFTGEDTVSGDDTVVS